MACCTKRSITFDAREAAATSSQWLNHARRPRDRYRSALEMIVQFQLIDLVSQGAAVQSHLKGVPVDEKLAWLAARGRVLACPSIKGFPQAYMFESRAGVTCSFFFRDDRFVFIGDNTTFTVGDHV
jgi:hypothetical protein